VRLNNQEGEMTMRIVSAFLFSILFAISALAQNQKTIGSYADIFIGYSYLNADANALTLTRRSLNGWKVSLSTNLSPLLAIDYDVAGHYKSYKFDTDGTAGLPPTVDMAARNYSIFAGPRLNYGPVFVHAMIGGDCLIGSTLEHSDSQWSLAGALGGGIQIPANERLAFRVSADYVISRHDLDAVSGSFALGGLKLRPSRPIQNNIGVAAGIVIKLGRRH
jgi:hypothetical protein